MGAETLGLNVCSVPVVTAAFTEKPCRCSEVSDRPAGHAAPGSQELALAGAGSGCAGHSPWSTQSLDPPFPTAFFGLESPRVPTRTG